MYLAISLTFCLDVAIFKSIYYSSIVQCPEHNPLVLLCYDTSLTLPVESTIMASVYVLCK